jgi:hypothetical protein
VKKSYLDDAPESFEDVVSAIKNFIHPLVIAITE